ncbi:MAG: FAD binding domain-containing protein [Acidobacteria bacterium]|nr:FAD binding domain-containing protein [Acidobacteriota bacterium]MBV9068668.1 FAD binding domain-containing protein [Acidobacteriota bacterium]MBV9185500.1 FAD binding domain-containing protein [Acidobacteriota bacterium]
MRYTRPSTLAETLADLGQGGMALGGGTLLLPRDAADVGAEQLLVDLQALPLHDLIVDGGFLSIGAMVTLARIAASPLISPAWKALAQAAHAVGNPNVRRAATIGGNVAWPGGDLHAALLVLDASVVCDGGACELPIRNIIEGGVRGGALVTSIRLPQDDTRHSAYVKFAWRAASGKTIVAVAASTTAKNGAPRLAAAGVAARAMRLPDAEALLAGGPVTPEAVEDAARAAGAELPFEMAKPPGEKYRRRLVAEGVRRLLAAVRS